MMILPEGISCPKQSRFASKNKKAPVETGALIVAGTPRCGVRSAQRADPTF